MKPFESYLSLLAWTIKSPIVGEFSAVHFFFDNYHRATYRMLRPGKLKLVTNDPPCDGVTFRVTC
jgi:hypothetical protein